jgi:hypothetical protein
MNQAAQCSLDWLLESGNEPGPTCAKAVAQPVSRHATISSVSPDPGWPDASVGADATVHKQAADVDACSQSQSPASLAVQKHEPNNMVLHLEGLADASLDRRCEPGLPEKTTNQPQVFSVRLAASGSVGTRSQLSRAKAPHGLGFARSRQGVLLAVVQTSLQILPLFNFVRAMICIIAGGSQSSRVTESKD